MNTMTNDVALEWTCKQCDRKTVFVISLWSMHDLAEGATPEELFPYLDKILLETMTTGTCTTCILTRKVKGQKSKLN